ncbi:MAG: ATP-binding protein [Terricaulis sp.]
MDETERTRRTWVLTIRRFAEMAWTRHGVTRYISVAMAPGVVAVAVPGLWWLICAVFTALAVLVDRRSQVFFERLLAELDIHTADELKLIVRQQIMALAVISALYATPYVLLAFAPAPGPLFGLLFCAGAAVVCTSLHVMTRTMIFYTLPVIGIGIIVNAAMLTTGWMSVLIGVLATMTSVNAVVAARGGAASFGDLIAARLAAEEDAENLEQRVDERTAQLAVAMKRAQAANRAKSMFLANMSHELRTPLNAVIGYAEIVEEDVLAGTTESSPDDLAKIRNSASHLLNLINEVLDLSRIEAGKLELNVRELNVGVLMRETLDIVRPLATRNGTSCRMEMDDSVVTVCADETRVRQCFLNLLSNAAKFTQNGQILIDARTCRLGDDEGVAIAVRDTGAGISSEDLARLFQPFVQADSTHTRKHDGAGLGLVITRRLARAMGGDVTAASKLGRGSTFTLYLPARMTAKAAA